LFELPRIKLQAREESKEPGPPTLTLPIRRRRMLEILYHRVGRRA